jgi:hypothetical protein
MPCSSGAQSEGAGGRARIKSAQSGSRKPDEDVEVCGRPVQEMKKAIEAEEELLGTCRVHVCRID